MKKLLLIQPHSDDVLLSCSHPFLFAGAKVQVLTVENDAPRIQEDKALYDFLGIPFHCLETEFKDDSYYGFYKKEGYKQMECALSERFLKGYYNPKLLEALENELVTFVKDFLKENKGYEVVAPLGIGHPFHQWVYATLRDNGLATYFYREFPHSYKRKAQFHMSERLAEVELYKKFPVKKFDDVKWDLARKFYRSQSGLLWFEQGYIKKRLDEEIYKLK